MQLAWLLVLAACQSLAQEPDPTEIPLDPELDAAPVGDTPEPETAEPAAAPVTRFELQIEFDDLIAMEDWAGASHLAETLLELTADEFGPDSHELAALRVKIAAVQSRNGEHNQAEANVQAAMEHFTDVDGPFAESMIEPYVVLGDNYYTAGDFVSAMSAYGEARTVSRRVNGLLNAGQIEIIDRMSDTAASLGQFVEARDLQLEALTLVERSYELHAPETLEAIYRYARWLRNNNLFTDEREQYARADRIIREYYGDESPMLVRPLRERANSYRTQGAEQGTGISGLRDALDILTLHPDADPLLAAEVWRDLGDWEVAFNKLGTDGSEYQQAWNLLARVDDTGALRDQWFSSNVIVLTGPLSRRSLSTAPDAPWGNVMLNFTVDTSGRTRDVEIVESNPPGLKDEAFARQFRLSRFRPMMRDGELISTRRTYDVKFQYTTTDE
jgi:TonB family protein